MQYLNIPTFQTLCGEAAVKALNDYVKDLAEQKPEELTDNQAKVLTTLARALIFSIQSEKTETSKENIRQRHSKSCRKVTQVILSKLRLSR
jgi:hypothetical protein